MPKITDFYLANFMSQMRDGFRPNQYKVTLTVPPALRGLIKNTAEGEEKFSFMCKTAVIPASTLGVVEVPFRGRQFKVAGDRTYAPWNVSVLADTEDPVRAMLEQWSDNIVGNVNHDSTLGNDSLAYMSTGDVLKLSRNGDILDTYKLIGIWPQEVGEISLGYDQTDAVSEYPVVFNVQWVENDNSRNNTEAQLFEQQGGQRLN